MIRRIICFITILACMLSFNAVYADDHTDPGILQALFTGEIKGPVHMSLSAPSFRKLSQFGKERITALNRLLQHISLDIVLDGDKSGTTVSVDSDPVFSVFEGIYDGITRTQYSFEEGKVHQNDVQREAQTALSGFLDDHFFSVNRKMDGFYELFGQLPEAFPELAKKGTSGIQYKGFGKAVNKVTMQFSADYVRDHFPNIISDMAETEELRIFLRNLVFHGAQRITLQYYADNQLMSISYNGTVGISADQLRKVSVLWKCLRSEEKIKDSLSLKTPAVKGFDKYNLSYERELDLNADLSKPVVSWDYQLDQKDNDLKRKIQYKAELLQEGNVLTGNIKHTEKQNGNEYSIIIVPEMKKENDQSYSGTIEITNKTGKIESSSVKSLLSVSGTGKATMQDTLSEHNNDICTDGPNEEEALQIKMYSLLIRKLITLPASDTVFLSQDIPENVWNSITQSLYK